MNIRDFLMDNFVYIIIVIVLTIITIIGFLADKKKNGDKKVKTMAGTIANNQNMGAISYGQQNNMAGPMTYQPNIDTNQNNSQGMVSPQPMMNNQILNTNMPPVNNQFGGTSELNNMNNLQPASNSMMNNQPVPNSNPIPNPIQDNNLNMPGPTVPLPVEPINQNIGLPIEPMYQPIAEQQPMLQGPMNQPEQPMNNGMTQPIPQMSNGMSNNFQDVQPIGVVPMMNNQMSGPIPNMMQPNMEANNPAPLPVMPNQGNVAPMPIPASPNMQPIPEPVMNNQMPGQVTPPQPVSTQPINFVYGPQQNNNNNQYMQ